MNKLFFMLLLLPVAYAAVGVSPTSLYFSEPEQQLFLINTGNEVPFSISGCDDLQLHREGVLEEGLRKLSIRYNPFSQPGDCTLSIMLEYGGFAQTLSTKVAFPQASSEHSLPSSPKKILFIVLAGIGALLCTMLILKYM